MSRNEYRNACLDQRAEALEEKEMNEYYEALYNQEEMEELTELVEDADKIYEGNWYDINNGTIVKCVAIIQEDIIIGLLFSEVSREPITKCFTMKNQNDDKNEYEPIQTFQKIDYQAYLCWRMHAYDTSNCLENL